MGNSSKKKKVKTQSHWNGVMVGTGTEPIEPVKVESPPLNAVPATTQEVVGEFVSKLIKLRQDNPDLVPSPEEQAAAAERLRRTMEALGRASETVREHLDRIGAAYSINETANVMVIDIEKLAVIESEG